MARARIRGLPSRPRSKGGKQGKAKNPAAVSLGSLGGKVGGPARARKLSGSKRGQIAKHAANSRWGNRTAYKKPATYTRRSS